ncbi:MAG: thiamine pyrophosphate-dependent enzyme [Rhodospirillales bacterium]|nr:thiamine pyrophosphate-dependent enzyme [Rhodospirillales bacterium]
MTNPNKPAENTALLISGNEAVARGVWEAGVDVATAYPGTPSTEILEAVGTFDGIHANWSPNEKVALEVAAGASMAGSRAFSAMKHVGLNVAADALMTLTLTGVNGGLVIAVADDVGMSSSQNEQDSRYWGRFGHVPILEPSDSQDAYDMTKAAFEISEKFNVPVILRMTSRVCHVKTMVNVGERQKHEITGFNIDPSQWVMVPGNAKGRLVLQHQRDKVLKEYTETCELTVIEEGSDTSVGFITSGPAYMHVKEACPDMSVMKLGLTHPLPIEKIRAFAKTVDTVIIAEETEPLVELELTAAGIKVVGKDILPAFGELTPKLVRNALRKLNGETIEENKAPAQLFPRPPTMCSGCPHLGVYYTLSRFRKNAIFSGDIGCYTLGAGHPWNALDTCVCMGSAIGLGLGMDLARKASGEDGPDKDKAIFAIIGDSTFLHMGIQGLLDLVYNNGNVTVMLLDNSTTGMTGGQDNHSSGRDLRGNEAPKVNFTELVKALGMNPERIREVDPYEMPTLYRVIKEEIAVPEPSVIITNRPCVLIDTFESHRPLKVIDDECTGCGNCLNVGCPAIIVTKRSMETTEKGKEVEKAWVKIETQACTGCDLCPKTCGPNAIVPATLSDIANLGAN